ncbi:MAG: helix-turn-helix domain-containing protein [Pseudorhodoplanes sp.]
MRGPASGNVPGARRSPAGNARAARADCHRGRAPIGKPGTNRCGHACARRYDGRYAEAAGRGQFPEGAPDRLLRVRAGDDRGSSERSRQARRGGHRGSPDPAACADRSERELVFTGRPIHEIAYELGFADPSHFARFFRKQTAMSPQDFRAQQLR